LDGTIGPAAFEGEPSVENIAKFVIDNIQAVNEDYQGSPDDGDKGHPLSEEEIEAMREEMKQYVKKEGDEQPQQQEPEQKDEL